VFEPEVYDSLFGNHVDRNDEGAIPARAVPFEATTIGQLGESGQVSPGASAAIHLAWRHHAQFFASNPTIA
jgi:hypothetical protein